MLSSASQIWLASRQGLMFKVGVFMGWSDLVAGPVPWHVLVPVYLGCWLWTITYETVYQHQVRLDSSMTLHDQRD